MSVWKVSGGKKLYGDIRIQGSKNAVLPIMAAAIITGCETELLNCPQLSDVEAAVADIGTAVADIGTTQQFSDALSAAFTAGV